MAAELAKTADELKQMPLVELAWEILRVKQEPYYFRDLMKEIQRLRDMSEADVTDIIARVYTEINIDGRFVCVGHNVWGLKRWYPVDKGTEKQVSSKRFVRQSGDAFSDDDEDLDEDFELVVEEEPDDDIVFVGPGPVETSDDDDDEDGLVVEDEDNLFSEDDDAALTEDEDPALDGEAEEESDDEDDDSL